MRSPLFCAALVLGVATDAVAEGQLYVGLGAGVAEVSFDYGLNDRDTALQVFVGYALNRYVAAEIGYLDAGTAEQRFGASLDTRGVVASALGILPLGDQWSLFARVGVLGWQWEAAGIEHEGADFTYGLGGAVRIARLQFRLEGGGARLDDDELRYATLQGLWRF